MSKEKKTKKSINIRVATRGLIIGFASYAVLLTFIFFSLIVVINWKINQTAANEDTIKYITAVCAAFLMFFLIRGVCKLSTFDLFRSFKIKSSDVDKVATRMNLFFIICVILSSVISLGFINLNLNNAKITLLQNRNTYYSTYNEEYAAFLTLNLMSKYRLDRINILIETFIIESGVIFGLFSLTTIQKNLIEKYNEPSEEEPEDN